MNEPIANNRVRKNTHTISWNELKITGLSATAPIRGVAAGGVFDGGVSGFLCIFVF